MVLSGYPVLTRENKSTRCKMIISAGKISRFTDFLCIQFMGLRTRVCSKIELQVSAQRIILSPHQYMRGQKICLFLENKLLHRLEFLALKDTLQTQTLYSSQGTPCESIPTEKNLFSLQGTPVLITGSLFSLQGFTCISLYFPVRDCSVVSTKVGSPNASWVKTLHVLG